MTLLRGQTNPNEDPLSASQSETTSQEGKATSKSGKKVTMTQAEIDKIKSDAKAEEGRKWKKVETERDELKTNLTTLTTRLSSLETEARNRAYEEARSSGDSNALTLFQRNEDLAKRERLIAEKETEIRRRELQAQENESSFNTRKAKLVVPSIAAKYGLKTEDLADFNITDEETLDKIAQRISGKKPEVETEPETEEGEQKPFEPISFQSSGAAVKGKIKTVEDVQKASVDQIAAQFYPKPSK